MKGGCGSHKERKEIFKRRLYDDIDTVVSNKDDTEGRYISSEEGENDVNWEAVVKTTA